MKLKDRKVKEVLEKNGGLKELLIEYKKVNKRLKGGLKK